MNQFLFSTRTFSAVFAAASVTIALFYIMTMLIEMGEVAIDEVPSISMVDFVRLPSETPEVQTAQPNPAPPPVAAEPPRPTISPDNTPSEWGQTQRLIIEPPQKPSLSGLSNGEYLPLVKVQPSYPRNALARGIEGYVIVEFDLSPDGSVRNPRVIENYPNAMFDKSAIAASLKFRYKPTVKNGQPISVQNVRNRFSFTLTQ